MNTEERDPEVGLLAGSFLALPRLIEVAVHHIDQVRPAPQHFVVHGGGTDHPAFAAAACTVDAKQTDHVAPVEMKTRQPLAAIGSCIGIADLHLEIRHLTEEVAAPALRQAGAEIGAQSPDHRLAVRRRETCHR
jgi:hypothetical protein